ncbi:peptidase M22 [Alicyclobacillus tolerans]|uniref:peptidase M22 n=1 Tax=Alicyclobacillus tolerans TaxID=90970 RepID=UPI001F24FE47|nr:peptidase M22 [Alicyclobacillus tolerans]MCF8563597.1 peptidase M22 [Alicyclobacillus tolerans]
MTRLVLGIDTSNYTTSLCAVSLEDGTVVAEARKLLPVEAGQRGLRQSDALFFHVQRLPQVMNDLMSQIRDQNLHTSWAAVGVSVRPRPLSASYMPVFQAGSSFAHTFARSLSLPVLPVSHQEGHLAAAQHFLDMPKEAPFVAVHISGGTSDVLVARPTRFGYAITPLGEGADLHAGQFIDRVGVALGGAFPAGPFLEQLAKSARAQPEFRLTSSATGTSLSFSGPCSAALRAIEAGVPGPDVAFAVQQCVANSVAKAVANACVRVPEAKYCVIAGGVAANAHIRERTSHRLAKAAPNLEVLYAPPRFSSDNALGPAALARKHWFS